MASTEDIEARLCAYIDGELDETAQAEIERHLASNPQHRELLTDLMEQRDMIRALPRVRAPQELTETLGAQLERAALLGDDLDEAVIVRISRWPQIRAAAAILLLVFGLAAVVYYVLPGRNAATVDLSVAIAPPDASAPSVEPDVTASPGDGGFWGAGVVLIDRGEPDPDHRPHTLDLLRHGIRLGDSIPAVPHVISNAVSPLDLLIGEGLVRSAPARSQVCVEIVSPDPFVTARQVAQYLSHNRIAFEVQSTDAAMPEPLGLTTSQRLLASRLQQVESRLNSATAPREAKLPGALGGEVTPAEAQNNAAADQSRLTYLARRMSRRDVQQMCSQVSHGVPRQRVLAVQELTQQPHRSRSEFAPATHPDSAPRSDAARGFALEVPATQPVESSGSYLDLVSNPAPSEDEIVDVVIVVRDDNDDPGSQTSAVDSGIPAPTTSPTTAPSEP